MSENPFHESSIAKEDYELLQKLREELSAKPDISEVPIDFARAARDNNEGNFPTYPINPDAVDIEFESRNGGPGVIRVTYPTSKPIGIYIHIHGGGWTFGKPWHQDWRMKRFAKDVGCITASIKYRLTPENPWPNNLNDCEEATTWIMDNSHKKFGIEKFIIGGDSAGAHLSAATLLRLKNNYHINNFVGALFTYGVFDLNLTPSARNWGSEKLILSTPAMEYFIENLKLGDLPKTDPYLSPLHADLRNLPNAFFQCGTHDPLVDDTSFMASRWQAAGNNSLTTWYPGGVHGFDLFNSNLAKKAINDSIEFLRQNFIGKSE